MMQTINFFNENQDDVRKIMVIHNGGTQVLAVQDAAQTRFVGVSANHDFYNPLNETPINLLKTAVNNRTRERNYFRLLTQFLNGDISEAEFEKEIEDNEDRYVLDCSHEPSLSQFEMACFLSSGILDVESADDFLSLFSFSEEKSFKLLNNGE